MFIHVPKAAGTTFIRLLESYYPERVRYKIPSKESYDKAIRGMNQKKVKDLKLLQGHMRYDAKCLLAQDFQAITFLRDPYSRAQSFYKYILSHNYHPQHEALTRQSLSFEEYLRSGLYEPNSQCLHLAGDHGAIEADESVFKRALRRIKDGDIFAGTVEQFDDCLFLMYRCFQWPFLPLYTRENRSKAEFHLEHTEDSLRCVADLDHYDLRLHREASKRVSAMIDEMSKREKWQLFSYRRLNTRYRHSSLFRDAIHRCRYSRFSPIRITT